MSDSLELKLQLVMSWCVGLSHSLRVAVWKNDPVCFLITEAIRRAYDGLCVLLCWSSRVSAGGGNGGHQSSTVCDAGTSHSYSPCFEG